MKKKDEFNSLNYLKESISPTAINKNLQSISKPHLDSFNSLFTKDGVGLLDLAVLNIDKITVFKNNDKLTLWLSSPQVSKPTIEQKNVALNLLYPSECRERQLSYKAKFQLRVNWRINNGPVFSEVKHFGSIPIMVQSEKCNLYQKSPQQLIEKHEEAQEFGGYFITNGIERLIRLLIVPRRNLPTAIIRPSFQNRGNTYSKFGVQIRCVRNDQTSQTLTIHYCTDGSVNVRFAYKKNEYMVPVLLILKALMVTSDSELFERITCGDYSNTFLTDRVEMLLRSFRSLSCYSKESCCEYLGRKFGVMLGMFSKTLRWAQRLISISRAKPVTENISNMRAFICFCLA